MFSAALSQPCDFRQEREDEYMRIIGKYSKSEQGLFPKMVGAIVDAFEKERFADILGDMYMQLELGNHWKGQFFTPYNVTLMMSKMTIGDKKTDIEKNGYTTITDPCCGGGAMLIAAAQSLCEQEINYHHHALFVAQDIDPVVARMCYIQLALLGCPGYVIIGNSLTQPGTGHVLFPSTGKIVPDAPDADIWYLPFFFTEVWHWRRAFVKMDILCNPTGISETAEPPKKEAPEEASSPISPIKVQEKSKSVYEQLSLF